MTLSLHRRFIVCARTESDDAASDGRPAQWPGSGLAVGALAPSDSMDAAGGDPVSGGGAPSAVCEAFMRA